MRSSNTSGYNRDRAAHIRALFLNKHLHNVRIHSHTALLRQGLIRLIRHFHDDNGAGLDGNHQNGWTGLVAQLIDIPNNS